MATFNPLTGVSFDDTMEIPTYEEMMKPYESYKAQYDKDEAAAVETQAAMAQYLPYIGTEGAAYDAYQKMQNRINRYSSYIGTPAYMLHRDEYMKLAKDYAEQNAMFKNALEGYNQSEKEVRALMAKDPTNFTRFYHIDENGNVVYDDNHTLNNHWGNKQVYTASVSGTDVMNLGKETGKSFSSRAEEVKGYGGIKKALNELGQIVTFQSRSSREGVPNVITIDMILDPEGHKAEWDAFEKNDHVGQYTWWIKNLKSGELGEQMRRDLMQSKDNNGVSAFDKMTQKDQKALIEKYLAGVYKGLDYKEDNQYQEQGHTPPGGGSNKIQQLPPPDITQEGVVNEEDLDNKTTLTEDENGHLKTAAQIQAESHLNDPEVKNAINIAKNNALKNGRIVSIEDFVINLSTSSVLNRGGLYDSFRSNNLRAVPIDTLKEIVGNILTESGINIKDKKFAVKDKNGNAIGINYDSLVIELASQLKKGTITENAIRNAYDTYVAETTADDVEDIVDDIYKKNGWGSYKNDSKTTRTEHEKNAKRVADTVNLPGDSELKRAENGRNYFNNTRVINSKGVGLNTNLNHTQSQEMSELVKDIGSYLSGAMKENEGIFFNKSLEKAASGLFEYDKEKIQGKINENSSDIKAVNAKDGVAALQNINRMRVVDNHIVFSVKDSDKEYILKSNIESIKRMMNVAQAASEFTLNNINSCKQSDIGNAKHVADIVSAAKAGNQKVLKDLATNKDINRVTLISEHPKMFAVNLKFNYEDENKNNVNDAYIMTIYEQNGNYRVATATTFSDLAYGKGETFQAQYSNLIVSGLYYKWFERNANK